MLLKRKYPMCTNYDYLVMAALILLMLGGCTSDPKKVAIQEKGSFKLDSIKPLATELGDNEQYKLALDVAEMELENDELDKAEKLLTKLRKYNPDDIKTYRLLSKLYEKQNKLEMAFISAEAVLSKTGNTKNDEQRYARLALLNSEYAKAEEVYQRWLDDSHSTSLQVIALNNLGFSALLQQKFDKAQGYFERALQIDPLNQKARNNLKLISSTTHSGKDKL